MIASFNTVLNFLVVISTQLLTYWPPTLLFTLRSLCIQFRCDAWMFRWIGAKRKLHTFFFVFDYFFLTIYFQRVDFLLLSLFVQLLREYNLFLMRFSMIGVNIVMSQVQIECFKDISLYFFFSLFRNVFIFVYKQTIWCSN